MKSEAIDKGLFFELVDLIKSSKNVKKQKYPDSWDCRKRWNLQLEKYGLIYEKSIKTFTPEQIPIWDHTIYICVGNTTYITGPNAKTADITNTSYLNIIKQLKDYEKEENKKNKN